MLYIQKTVYIFQFALLAILVSCSMESDEVGTEYIIANSFNGRPVLSFYNVSTGKINDVSIVTGENPPVSNSSILEMLLTPKGIIVVLSNTIQIIDPMTKSVIISKSQSFSAPTYLASSKNQVYIATIDKGISYLMVFNANTLELMKRIAIGTDSVYALTVVNNRIFISYEKFVIVLNADNYGEIAEFEFTSICSDLLSDSQNNMLIFYENNCTLISNTSSAYRNFKLPGAHSLSLNKRSPSVTIDRETDILYFFELQLNAAEYTLRAFDLRQNAYTKILTNSFFGDGIYFDQRNKRILLAEAEGTLGKGKIRILDTSGSLLNQIVVPGRVAKISFKLN